MSAMKMDVKVACAFIVCFPYMGKQSLGTDTAHWPSQLPDWRASSRSMESGPRTLDAALVRATCAAMCGT